MAAPHPNRAAAPGYPLLPSQSWRPISTIFHLLQTVLWVTSWPSTFELLCLLVLTPLLLVGWNPLLNNVVEEVLSWVYGKNGDAPYPPNSKPWEVIKELQRRVARSVHLLRLWVEHGATGDRMPFNWNYSFTTYLQGLRYIKPCRLAPQPPPFPSSRPDSRSNALFLACCSNIAYERDYVSRDVIEGPGEMWPSNVRVAAAYHFDYVLFAKEGGAGPDRAQVDTNVILLRVGLGEDAALVVAFRGSQAFNVVDWLCDFDARPPEDPGCYGNIHPGFQHAIGLSTDLVSDKTCSCSYLCYDVEERVYKRRPPPRRNGEIVTANTSPFATILAKVSNELSANPRMKLYVTGHSLGGALANLFTTAYLKHCLSPSPATSTDGRGAAQSASSHGVSPGLNLPVSTRNLRDRPAPDAEPARLGQAQQPAGPARPVDGLPMAPAAAQSQATARTPQAQQGFNDMPVPPEGDARGKEGGAGGRCKVDPQFGALYTFGQPRVGDYTYCQTLEQLLARAADLSSGPKYRRYLRVVNTYDIVPRMPPPIEQAYQHPGHLVYLRAVPLLTTPRCDDLPHQTAEPASLNHGMGMDECDEADMSRKASEEVARQLSEQPSLFWVTTAVGGFRKACWGLRYAWKGNDTWLRAFTRWASLLFISLALLLLSTTTSAAAAVAAVTVVGLPLAAVLQFTAVLLAVFAVLAVGVSFPVSDHAMSDYIQGILHSCDADWHTPPSDAATHVRLYPNDVQQLSAV